MANDDVFNIRINPASLKKRQKDTKPETVAKTDEVAERHGFEDRMPRRKRGRKPSPRTGQVHAKVMPNVAKEISQEARRRGVQQGVLIEEAWALYLAQQK